MRIVKIYSIDTGELVGQLFADTTKAAVSALDNLVGKDWLLYYYFKINP